MSVCSRVSPALTAKNVPFKIEYISLSDKLRWFLDISPNGQVPLLVTESRTTLFESDAIIEYIEDEFDPIEEAITNEQRTLDRAWSYLGSKNYLVQCGAMSSKDKETLAKRSEKLKERNLTSTVTSLKVEDIWAEYQSSLKAFLYKNVSNHADVDDLLQEILLITYQNLKRVKTLLR